MADEEAKQEAVTQAKRAGTQAKRAARNTGRAANAAAEVAKESIEESADNVVDLAEAAADKAAQTSKRVSPKALAAISGNTGQGFIALSVAIWAGSVAAHRFNAAYAGRSSVIKAEDVIR